MATELEITSEDGCTAADLMHRFGAVAGLHITGIEQHGDMVSITADVAEGAESPDVNTIRTMLAAAGLIGALGGCAPAAAPPEHTMPATQPPHQPDTYRFGQTHHDAYTTTVGNLREFTTGPFAQPVQHAPAFAVDIKLTNNTGQTFHPAVLTITGAVGGQVQQQVFDSQFGGIAPYAGAVPPEQTVTLTVGFTKQGGGPLSVTVASMDGSQSYTWTQ